MKRRKQMREKKDSGSQENKKDRLSDLPDCVLLHIFSFMNIRDAVQTCLLSTRWKNLWKNLPTLTLSSYHFTTSEDFTKFVMQILSLRDAFEPVSALDFHCGFEFQINPDLIESVITYAVSHNINRLSLYCRLRRFPPSLFSCPSLTSLDIWHQNYDIVKFPNSLELPALTYLKLRWIAFSEAKDGRVEPFSTFKKLNTLILGDILFQGAKTICISSTTLLNLSIELDMICIYRSYSIELSAPNLCSFTFSGDHVLNLYGNSLNSIKEVSINVPMEELPSNRAHFPLILLNWLINFVNITSLTVSATTLQVLSLVPDLLKAKSPSWYNLKSLKVQVLRDPLVLSMMNRRDANLSGESHEENANLQKVMKGRYEPYLHIIPEGIVDFLLQNSPSAEFEIVSVK